MNGMQLSLKSRLRQTCASPTIGVAVSGVRKRPDAGFEN